MPRTSTKTVTTEPQQVDVDGDGDIDATVSHSTTITIEGEDQPVQMSAGYSPIQRASGDPGECGETPCWSRTALTFTEGGSGLTLIATPAWPGNIAWDFGDGSDVVVGRGPVEHTYGVAGPYTVTATPLASSCLKAGTAVVTVA